MLTHVASAPPLLARSRLPHRGPRFSSSALTRAAPSRYIAAQILGAYVACLLIYVQWGDPIKVRARSLFLGVRCPPG